MGVYEKGERIETVGELVNFLKQYQSETPVLFEMCSDYEFFDTKNYRPELQTLVWKRDRACRYYPHQWEGRKEQPVLREFVVFPGS